MNATRMDQQDLASGILAILSLSGGQQGVKERLMFLVLETRKLQRVDVSITEQERLLDDLMTELQDSF